MADRVEAQFDYRKAVERELVNDARTVGRELGEYASRGADAARGYAPVRTGAYVGSIGASLERGSSGYEGRVSSSIRYGGFIEYGTRDTPAFAPIRKGLAAASRGAR